MTGCWRHCTLNQQVILIWIWILQLLPFRFQHRNQDNVHSLKMLFDEMKFFHLEVASLAPCACAMGAVERDYDQLSFYPGLEELCHCCHWCGHEELCPRQIRPDSTLLIFGQDIGITSTSLHCLQSTRQWSHMEISLTNYSSSLWIYDLLNC